MIFSAVTGSSGGVKKVPGHPISLMPHGGQKIAAGRRLGDRIFSAFTKLPNEEM
jgi:hypothetical protein